MEKVNTAPLLENEYVKELLAIMENNHMSTMKDMLDVLDYVGAMEQQLNNAMNELQAMRREVNEAQRQNHPAKTSLQNAVHTLENNIAAMRERLEAVKQNIIDGCKNAVTAFKEKGLAALNNVASFFKIKSGLMALRDTLNDSIKVDEKAIAKIEAVSAEYHEAGKHLKNIGRAMAGKEAIQDANPPGKLAKVLKAPFLAERSCFIAMRSNSEAAINHLARLEKTAERKPSIRKTMQTLNEQIKKAPKAPPAPAVRRDER